ncbi:MAG: TonB-dependent receptor [Bacteroidota bacterium]|nr:TonB-dependent receptor [Bacteroidota bacterium]MDP4217299.1 TonB-dependent receptor [Bacteroidota bacterium]MDP4246162.1 TonB-dependent receptor [Bacteroidota bacterium]MDP4253969.1 TonB-dependent receptor [Bacteroidota bacterium]
MSKKHIIVLALAASLCGSSWAQAQDSGFKQLDEVVVTATKYPVKENLTGKVLTVITKEQLEKSGGKQLGEVLNTQAGLTVSGSQNSLGTPQEVYLQGADAGKTLILIDGIPAYDPSGTNTAFDLNLINTDEVERVEILKGSQSTLYGSDAVAGVINIITRKGKGKPLNASADLSAGSFGTYKLSGGIDGSPGNTSYALQYTHLRSDGISSAYDSSGKGQFDHDGFTENLLMFHLDQRVTEALHLHGHFQWSKYRAGLDAGAYTDDRSNTTGNQNTQFGLGADYALGSGTLHVNYSYNDVTRDYLDDSAQTIASGGTFSSGSYTGKSHYAELYGHFSLAKKVELLVGADYRNQGISQSTLFIYYNSYFPPYGPVSLKSAIGGDSARVRQFAGYASFLLKDLAGFNLELGGRYNSFNKYGNVFTWSVNPSFVAGDRVKLFANLSSGFSAPTLYQLYSQYANPFGELKPERTISLETGVQYSLTHFNARAVFFRRSTTDNIIYYTVDPNFPNGYYMNLDKQKDQGVEVETGVEAGKWTFSGNYTYTTGQVTTPVNGKDSTFYDLYRRPKNVVNLSAGWQADRKLFCSLSLHAVGKRIEPVYGGPPSTFDTYAYYTLNGYIEYKLQSTLKLFADLKNMTNQTFFDIPGYNSMKFNFMAGIYLHL